MTARQREYICEIFENSEWVLPDIDLDRATKGEASDWIATNAHYAYERIVYDDNAGDRV